MEGLTQAEIERQDYVDGRIFELLGDLLPPEKAVAWDIDMIGDIRDAIRAQLVEKKQLIGDAEFYPFAG